MNQKTGAVLAELRGMNEAKFITAEDSPIKVINWRLLVQPMPPKKQAEVLALAEQTQEAEEYLTSFGKVIDMGHFAYKSKTNAGLNLADEPNIPKVGDFVLFAQYAGQEVVLNNPDKTKLRVIDDTEVLGIVRNPEMIKRYV